MLNKTLDISTSPHIVKGLGTDDIMRNVVWALMPVVGFAVYAFGLSGLLVISTTLIACLVTEHLLCRWAGKDSTISDWSAAITGIFSD